MPIVRLIPNSTSDPSTTIASGSHLDIDETSVPSGGAGDGNFCITNVNQSNGDFTFGLSDLPGPADTINSATLRIRARISGTYDNDTSVWTISATVDGASQSFDFSVGADRVEVTKTVALTAETVATLNAESITVSQTSWSQSMGPDGSALEIEFIEIEVDYEEGAAPHTADGSPSITPITADGTAKRELPADGSPSISAITADGSAKRELPSDGSPSITPIESTGAAKQFAFASSGAAYFDGFQRASLGTAYNNGPNAFDEMEIIASSYVQAATSGDCIALHNVSLGNDQFVEVEMLNHNGASLASTQLTVRMNGATIDGYVASFSNDVSGDTYFNIYRVDEFVPAVVATSGIIASGGVSYPDGTRLRLECEGTAFRAYLDGVLVASGTDAVYPSGDVGFGISAIVDQTDVAVERWWFGEIGAGAAISNVTSEGSATIVEEGNFTADGAPSITSITADGSAKRELPSDGSPSITPITADGEAEVIQTADGSPSINPITADGAAKIIREASGGPSISPITAEGVAEILRTATGSPSISSITAAGNSFIWPKVYLNTSQTLIGATEMTVSSVDIDGTSITFDDSVGPPVGNLFLGVENRVNGDVGWIAVEVTEAVGPTVVFGGFGA